MERISLLSLLLFISLISSLTTYASAYNNKSLTTDITNTYQALLQKKQIKNRVGLVDRLVKKASDERKKILKKDKKNDADVLMSFHVNILKEFYDDIDKTNSTTCIRSFNRLKHTLYPTKFEKNQRNMLPFQKSVYNLYGKMCLLEFETL